MDQKEFRRSVRKRQWQIAFPSFLMFIKIRWMFRDMEKRCSSKKVRAEIDEVIRKANSVRGGNDDTALLEYMDQVAFIAYAAYISGELKISSLAIIRSWVMFILKMIVVIIVAIPILIVSIVETVNEFIGDKLMKFVDWIISHE